MRGCGALLAPIAREDDDPDGCDSGLSHADLIGGCQGKIDDAIGPDATIVDANDDGLPIAEIDDADEGSEGQCRVAGGERSFIEDLSARGLVPIEHVSVPGAHAREQISWDGDIGVAMGFLRSARGGSRRGMKREIAAIGPMHSCQCEDRARSPNDGESDDHPAKR